MSIPEILREITLQRNNTAVELAEKKKKAEEIIDGLQKLQSLTETLSPELREDYAQLFSRNPWLESMLSDTEAMQECERLYRDAAAELEKLITRFQRDTINISVVGDSRAGKSRFLQTISGLDNNSIPSFEGRHCTGVRSIIQNDNSMTEGVRAVFTFKTEDEILDETNQKLSYITDDQLHIASLHELSTLTLQTIRDHLRNDWQNAAAAEGYIAAFWDMYIQNHSEWAPLIGLHANEPNADILAAFSLTLQDDRLICTQPEQILKYIAKHDGTTPQGANANSLYRYIAVKSVEIFTSFALTDVDRLKLVDTVGLGDLAAGTTQKMYDAIDNESDAVLFFFCPNPAHGGQIDSRIFDICNFDIYPKYGPRQMKKWMAILVNNYNNLPAAQAFVQQFQQICPRMAENVVFKHIVDVSQQNDVSQQCLIPLLNSMAQNIGDIDARFMIEADEKIRAADETFMRFASGFSLIDLPKRAHIIRDNFTRMFKRLTTRIQALRGTYTDIPDSLLEDSIQAVTAIQEHGIPEIIQGVQSMGATISISERSLAFVELAKKVRSIAYGLESNLSTYEREFKENIAEILLDELKFEREKSPRANSESFFADMADGLFGNQADWEILRDAFTSMHRFKLESSRTITMILFNHYIDKYFNINRIDEPDDGYAPYMPGAPASLEDELRGRIVKFIDGVRSSDLYQCVTAVSVSDQMIAELNYFIQRFDITYHRLWDNVLTAQLEAEMIFKEDKLRIDELSRAYENVKECVESATVKGKTVNG